MTVTANAPCTQGMNHRNIALIIVLGLTGCSDWDERTGEFGGDHEVTVTNLTNGCELPDWNVDESFDMSFNVVGRDGFGAALGTFEGPEAAALRGTDEYYGDIIDDELVMNGLQRFIDHENGCSYSVYTDLTLTINDGLLTGQFVSTLAGGYQSSHRCGAMYSCQTIQELRSIETQ